MRIDYFRLTIDYFKVKIFVRESNLMVSQKVPKFVTPAKAGVQNILERLDSGFRRNDAKREFLTFYEGVKLNSLVKSRT